MLPIPYELTCHICLTQDNSWVFFFAFYIAFLPVRIWTQLSLTLDSGSCTLSLRRCRASPSRRRATTQCHCIGCLACSRIAFSGEAEGTPFPRGREAENQGHQPINCCTRCTKRGCTSAQRHAMHVCPSFMRLRAHDAWKENRICNDRLLWRKVALAIFNRQCTHVTLLISQISLGLRYRRLEWCTDAPRCFQSHTPGCTTLNPTG